ncbi:adenine phosphoribosyltransferase [Marinicella sp. W31]|uniref:adenine phosphoribosyltransferase n=1 Tax=Marinicella sp. W31 TaxID=3023713 RepID=UPI0037576B95
MSIEDLLKQHVHEIRDFPKPGISFKDITPILANPELSKMVVTALAEHAKSLNVDAIVGIDSRGFLFGASLARLLDLPFVVVRKKGKLPGETIAHSYDLEYGSATLEIHRNAIQPGQRVLIHDDLLATGGTAKAAAELVQQLGGEIATFAFVIDLAFLNGSASLQSYRASCFSLLRYD